MNQGKERLHGKRRRGEDKTEWTAGKEGSRRNEDRTKKMKEMK